MRRTVAQILTREEIEAKKLPECFGSCVGGTECWESCGDGGDETYLACLKQAKALIEEAIEAEVKAEEEAKLFDSQLVFSSSVGKHRRRTT